MRKTKLQELFVDFFIGSGRPMKTGSDRIRVRIRNTVLQVRKYLSTQYFHCQKARHEYNRHGLGNPGQMWLKPVFDVNTCTFAIANNG